MNDALLQEITRRIAERWRPARIVLFGSRARGEARADSDVDLFVEMESVLPLPERAIEISRLFGLRDWGLDLVVYTPAEVARLRPVGGTLLETIEREGKLLYAAH